MKAVLLLALLATASGAQDLLDLPAELPMRYGVIGLRPRAIAPDTLVAEQVTLHSPAHRAGVRKGDRLIAIDSHRIRTAEELSRCVQSYAPGDTLVLTLFRDDTRVQIASGVTDIKRLYYLMDEQGRPAAIDHSERILAAPLPRDEAAARALVDRLAGGGLDSLRRALAFDADRYGRDGRLQRVDLALRYPLATGRIARGLIDDVVADQSLSARLKTAARHLDLDLEPHLDADPVPAAGAHSVLPFLLGPLAAANRLDDRAFAALTRDQRDQLPAASAALLARFGDTLLLDEGDSTETARHVQTLRQAKAVELEALFASALHLARLADPDTLIALRDLLLNLPPATIDSLPAGVDGPLLYAEHTRLGWVLIGDTGPNFYGANALAIIDLGGDDTYHHRHPSTTALIIDYAGDDRYLGNAIAAGVGRTGLLVDCAGNDRYQSDGLALGSAFCGIGILWDRRGNDRYQSGQGGQGAAFFGAGLLIDDAGDDHYAADLIAQGFGGMRGLGLLIDRAGNDRYLVDGQVPSSYGTPDTYAGWAQGVGCGFRGFGSGGIGLLVDERGADDYQGGDFAQGGGYFFGLGVLGDLRGDDRYRGSRYAQGAAAHQAVGVLLDDAGDDRYWTKIAASQGAGWDAAIGYLADLAGDDRYAAEHLSQGAAAMNGLGLLFDGGGTDDYGARTGQGQGGLTTYWGGRDAPNLGLLIDRGGATDAYSLRKNQADARDAGIGLFSDR